MRTRQNDACAGGHRRAVGLRAAATRATPEDLAAAGDAERRSAPGQWSEVGTAVGSGRGSWLAAVRRRAPAGARQGSHGEQPRPARRGDASRGCIRVRELADSTLYPQVNLLARGGGQTGGDASGLQGVGICSPTGSWTCGVASARCAPPTWPATSPSWPMPSTRGSRWRRWSRSRTSWPSRRACSSRSPSRWSPRPTSWSALAEQRQRVGKGDGYDAALARANARDVARHGRAVQAGARAVTACARGAGRSLSGGRRRGGDAAGARAGPGARRPAVGTARAAARRRRRRPARCRGVLRRAGSQGRAVAAHCAHGQRQ
jgi:hypothetical protein